jgi:alpha-ketoglutarate-dependent taurine dioxygenase
MLVFPRAGFSDDEQLALTDALGERVNVAPRVPGRTHADAVSGDANKGANIEREYVFGTFFWHMDGLTVDVPPPKATVLSARRLASKGGHTEFASTKAAYEALPAEEKAELAGLRVLHTVTASVREVAPPEALDEARRSMRHEHPLVWTRSDGTKSLIIGSTADQIAALNQAEARACWRGSSIGPPNLHLPTGTSGRRATASCGTTRRRCTAPYLTRKIPDA